MTEPSDSGSDRSAQVPYWQFVPPEDYAVPAVQMHKAAGKAWLSLQNLFRRKNSAATFKAEQDLHALSEVRLEHLVPPLSWDDAAAALDASLPDWLAAGSSDTCVKFVVGQPFCGHAEIVSLLGARHRATEVAPPSIEQILSNDESWLEGWPLPETFWVLPKLEHCYLRHACGLNLVRRLLCLATNGDLGQGVIGCDSWAWAYLQRIFPLPQAAAITLQAFDANRLQNLLYDQMTSRAQQKIHYFNVTAQAVKKETQDLINTLQQYTADQRDQAVKEADQALKKLDGRIDELENRVDKNWDKMSQAAREKIRASLRALRQQRNELSEWYGNFQTSSNGAWEKMKKGFSDAYQAISESWARAKSEYDKNTE